MPFPSVWYVPEVANYVSSLHCIVQGSSFATGLEVQEKRQTVQFISTGSKSVDAILGGKPCITFQHGKLYFNQ